MVTLDDVYDNDDNAESVVMTMTADAGGDQQAANEAARGSVDWCQRAQLRSSVCWSAVSAWWQVSRQQRSLPM